MPICDDIGSSIPLHDELRRGTLQSIIRQSGLPRPAFERSRDPASRPRSVSHVPHGTSYGDSRCNMRGNAMVSRMCSRPQIHATQRSIPMPKPPCGTVPYLRRSMYQLKASFGR